MAVIAVVLAGCPAASDAPPDAVPCPFPGRNQTRASCEGGLAVLAFDRSATTSNTCVQHFTEEKSCLTACAIEGVEVRAGIVTTGFPLTPLVLCAETPVAQLGDPCAAQGEACLPTRATLAPDGTVTGQQHLVCGADRTCIGTTAPTVPSYLAPCAPPVLEQYGTAGQLGVVADPDRASAACLLAWDAATSAIASGQSIVCVGDWECPAGALCDDQLPLLTPSTAPVAVCKPGPRGTLTPAMLRR